MNTMQTLYLQWGTQLSWANNKARTRTPTTQNDKYLFGPLLSNIGRSTGMDLWEAHLQRPIHKVYDIHGSLQIVAVSRNWKVEFKERVADINCRALTKHGDVLLMTLEAGGLLEDMAHVDTGENIHN